MATLSLNFVLAGQFGEYDSAQLTAGPVLTPTQPVVMLAGTATTTPGTIAYGGVSSPQAIVILNTHATVGLKVRVATTETAQTVPAGNFTVLHAPGNGVEVEAVTGSVTYISAIAK
jgi:hypothetical protein